jgi:secondary thiamine-phosphate synthase enzyme
MPVHSASFSLETRGLGHTLDVTPRVEEAVERSGLSSGTVTIFVPGSTAGVTTLEFEPGVVADVSDLFERLAPRDAAYAHEQAWHDGNGFSHVRAALLGPSLTVPFAEGRLALGTWQQIVLVDFDNRSRRRQIVVQVMGE